MRIETERKNLMDIVNGLHITITFRPRDFSYGDAFEALPDIIRSFYKGAGENPKLINLTSKAPDSTDLRICFFNRRFLTVCSIAPNDDGRKYHIHIFLYGVHQYNIDFKRWGKIVDRELRKVRSISAKGNPFKINIVRDEIDYWIRRFDGCLGDDYQPLVNYISSNQSGNLIGYFKERNNKNFIYHY
jgi:hypothetical protein